MMRVLFALLLALFAASAVQSREAAPLAADPVVEARMLKISEELRCLVCQNETLAASRAELADDLRVELRRLIKDGKSDEEIMEFMVNRYGDFVRYRPPVKPTTWVLWFGPFLLLLAGVVGLVRFLKRRNRKLAAGPLSDEDRRRAEALLGDGGTRT